MNWVSRFWLFVKKRGLNWPLYRLQNSSALIFGTPKKGRNLNLGIFHVLGMVSCSLCCIAFRSFYKKTTNRRVQGHRVAQRFKA